MPGAETAGTAAQLHALETGLDRLDAVARVLLAVLALHVVAGVIEQRVLGAAVAARNCRTHVQAGAGARDVVVGQGPRAGLYLAGQLPVMEVSAVAHLPVWRQGGDAGVAVHAGVGTIGIGQYQNVARLLVAEVVVAAFLLHQPADEVEAGFAVLHAVLPFAVAAAQAVLEVGETQVAEYLLDDVRYGP